MLRLPRRFGFILSCIALLAVCVSLPQSSVIAGKDAPTSASKSKRRPEKPKKSKKTDEEATGSQTQSKSSTRDDTASGGSLGSIPLPPSSGSSATSSSSKGGSSGRGKSSGSQPASKTKAPEQGPNPELVKKVMDIQNRATPGLMAQKGVVGTATGLDDDDNIVIRIYTTGADSPTIPNKIEGIPVVEVMKGPIFAAQSTIPLQQQQLTRPVPIGVSIFSDTQCSVGTLGCRLTDSNGNTYALSTNHVLAGATVTNAFGITSGNKLGTPAVQPAPSDNSPCVFPVPANQIGTLFAVAPITLPAGGAPLAQGTVDAAIIQTTKALVNSATPAGGYGIPASNLVNNGRVVTQGPAPFNGSIVTTAAFLGQQVQKYGRTTGYTQGKVTGINAQISTSFGIFQATFVGQIEVIAIGSSVQFGSFGDSGALVVDFNKNPVGLLFATVGNNSFCNPFDQVLQALSSQINSQLSTADPLGSPLGGGLPATGTPGPGGVVVPAALPVQKEGRSVPFSTD